MAEVEIGKGRTIRNGDELAFLTFGHIGNYAVEVTSRLMDKGISAGHFDMRFVKPLDKELLDQIFSNYKKIITVEDGSIFGGFGSAILEYMASNGYSAKVKILGIPDRVIEHGTQLELHGECGFDPDGIYQTAIQMLEPSMVSS